MHLRVLLENHLSQLSHRVLNVLVNCVHCTTILFCHSDMVILLWQKILINVLKRGVEAQSGWMNKEYRRHISWFWVMSSEKTIIFPKYKMVVPEHTAEYSRQRWEKFVHIITMHYLHMHKEKRVNSTLRFVYLGELIWIASPHQRVLQNKYVHTVSYSRLSFVL